MSITAAAKIILAIAMTSHTGGSMSSDGVASDAGDADSAQARSCVATARPSLGSPSAPVTVRLYLDPTASHALPMWLEARQMVGERPAELRVELVAASGAPPSSLAPRQRAVHRWFLAAAQLGRSEAALRTIAHHGLLEMQNRLLTSEGRRKLAAELGIDDGALQAKLEGTSLRCVDAQREEAASDLQRASASVLGRSRPPLVGISVEGGHEVVFAESERITEVRGRVDDLLSVPRRRATSQPLPLANIRVDVLTYDRTFPNAGALVGGDALPNRLVVLAENEDESRIQGVLGPALAFTALEPGTLSIQVIATGSSSRAILLRRRLCAARSLGLELEYLQYLAQARERRTVIAKTTDLLDELDLVGETDACTDDEPLADPQTNGENASEPPVATRRRSPTPHGAWLNGRPVSPGEMENLDLRFWARPRSSVLDWLWQPDPAE